MRKGHMIQTSCSTSSSTTNNANGNLEQGQTRQAAAHGERPSNDEVDTLDCAIFIRCELPG
eukprot:4933453-Amphidinium_carterae.3